MYNIPLIKSRIDCIEYAQREGLPVHKDGDRCKSPLRPGADNKSAFSVHKDYWYDFVAGQGGDVIDLAAAINHNGDRGIALYELARLTGVTSERDFLDWTQATQRRVSLIQGWHEDLRPQDREYLRGRRITDETINRLRIGFTGQGTEVTIKGEKVYGFSAQRIVIPFYKNDYVVSWVARATKPEQQPKYLKPPIDDYTEREPCGLHTLGRGTETLYIAEGTFDFLSIEQSGFPVLATCGGHFGKETLKSVLAIARNYKKIVLTFDNDEPGRKFTLDFGNILFSRKIPFAVAEIPNKYKDISDYYADENEIEKLNLQDGIPFLAKSTKDKEDFKKFAYKAARIMDRAELAEMFNTIAKAEMFSGVWLKEIQASCFRCPPEPIIVQDVLKEHNLIYAHATGFYEYLPQGKWALREDEVIDGFISDALGCWKSGGKLEPTKKLMRSEVFCTQQLDKAPVINFINGTLELETGNFREHTQDDYCSIQLPYPYLPDAEAPRWEKFIKEITADDAKREENLQFMAGYVLFNDCRHEKIFVLTGEGSNGKTIFTRVLTELFGGENVRNTTPTGLTEDFKAIHLRNALLNIAGEIKSDLSSTEERLKQLASGEAIQACYKGKDHIIFTPRAKLIFCCNGQLRSSDTSDGLARRLSIVDFPCKFVDFPDAGEQYQKQRDIDILDKLLPELSGIFNWAYQGYKDLIKFGGFTETDEHGQLMDNFRKASNPIECFVDELLDNPPDKMTRREAYINYTCWCEDNGHRPLSSTRFHPEFRKLTKKTYEDYCETVRINGAPRKERGYVFLEKQL